LSSLPTAKPRRLARRPNDIYTTRCNRKLPLQRTALAVRAAGVELALLTPSFSHHAECDLPSLESEGASLTVLAGEAFRQRSPVPVQSDLMYVDVVLKPDARLAVPIEHLERAAFVLSGEIEAAGQTFAEGQLVVFSPGAQIVLQAKRGAHLMLLGGEPFPEPRHVYWNFVSSSQDRIRQAADDWRNGRFPRIAGETDFIIPPTEVPHVCD